VGVAFFFMISSKNDMKNLVYNVNSVEETYGEAMLTTVIQLYERLEEISGGVKAQQPLNDLLREEFAGRIEKLLQLNRRIQHELQMQEEMLQRTRASITQPVVTG
jgi:hypothetical protein